MDDFDDESLELPPGTTLARVPSNADRLPSSYVVAVAQAVGVDVYDSRRAAQQAGLDVRDTSATRLPFTLWPHVDGRTR
jgi:hypothetical protein